MSITATSSTSTGSQPTGTVKSGQGSLGKDDFLKLLVGQLKHQDPMNPSSEDFMGQMAQFSMLEQISNVAQASEKMLGASQREQAFALIGKTVSYTGADKTVLEGKVESVQIKGGTPTVTVGGRAGVDPASLVEVRPA